MLCPICQKNKGIYHPYYGWLPCSSCRDKERKQPKLGTTVEFTTDAIREARKEFKEEIRQPFREGQLSKNYVKKYGLKGLKGVTPQEVRQAMSKPDVWNDIEGEYYKDD